MESGIYEEWSVSVWSLKHHACESGEARVAVVHEAQREGSVGYLMSSGRWV